MNTNDDIVICSLNVRGLADNKKRRETFLWLRRIRYALYMLQELHCSSETVDLWATEWGYKTIFSSFSSKKVGVCFLFNSNFAFEISKQYIDPNGRFIIADVSIENRKSRYSMSMVRIVTIQTCLNMSQTIYSTLNAKK